MTEETVITTDLDEIEAEEQPLYEHFRVEVDKGQVAVRIDKYLFERIQHSSRNRIQKAADAGYLRQRPPREKQLQGAARRYHHADVGTAQARHHKRG